jgi:hypothetical protein
MTATLATGAGLGARADATAACCPIVELRQYQMKPGQRDVLVEMFDAVFVDGQEAAGNAIMGQFRDLDNPDRFVWLRGFPDMAARPKSLDAFYTSATWQKHRNAANATMVDVSDVLLLHPLRPATGLALGKRPQDEAATGLIEAAIYPFDPAVDAEAIAHFDRDLETARAPAITAYVTEMSTNNYPRLPIRENENVLVRIAKFPTAAAHAERRSALTPKMRDQLKSAPQILRLSPTARSLLHG